MIDILHHNDIGEGVISIVYTINNDTRFYFHCISNDGGFFNIYTRKFNSGWYGGISYTEYTIMKKLDDVYKGEEL